MVKTPTSAASEGEARGQINRGKSPLSNVERRRLQEVQSHARASRTQERYNTEWTKFQDWLAQRGSDDTMPIDPELVALYLAECADIYTIGTIRVIAEALRHAHDVEGVKSPTKDPVVAEVIKGLAREKKGEVVSRFRFFHPLSSTPGAR